jgi:hypothetical protein
LNKWLMLALIVGGSAHAQFSNLVMVVNVETAEVFYVRDNKPVALDYATKGAEVIIEKRIAANCYGQYRGRSAYLRRDALVTKQEFFEESQRAKGLVEYRGQWLTPDEKFRQEQIAKGLVLYQDQWVTPAEKFRQEQIAKGLVQWKERWVTPDEMKEAQRAEFEAAQRAKGLMLHNGEWIPAEMLAYLDNAKSLIAQADDLFAQQQDYTRVQDLYKQAVASLQKYSELRTQRNSPDPEAFTLVARVSKSTAQILQMVQAGTLTVLPDGQLVPKGTNASEKATTP